MTHYHAFNNRFHQQLPFAYQSVKASPLSTPYLVAYSKNAANLIDLPLNFEKESAFLQTFSGQVIPQGGHHIAQVYSGHQFGHYVSQLGDGRSIFVGEIKNKQNIHFDIHLKGAGQTPYSRMGDGRAVLRSCIREFLASEAMAALNIPTTRALCIIGSDDLVYREQSEKGAIMTRLATTHIRFGNFEYLFHHGKHEELKQLANFCLETIFPQAKQHKKPYLALFKNIIKNTAMMIAKWQAVGFAHGVMNTDNMSISGLTLDYGPFAFLDDFQLNFVCNHSDTQGRYAFDQQPNIGLWNLNALAITFTKLINSTEIKQALSQYESILVDHYLTLMKAKFGLDTWYKEDQKLLTQWLELLAHNKADYTLSFRLLNLVLINDHKNEKCVELLNLFTNKSQIIAWLKKYRERLADNKYNETTRIALQNSVNAKYILRNYLAQNAIEQAKQGDFSEINTLLTILSHPFDEQTEYNHYAISAPSWGKNLEISCSS